ncbi:uncharacterized protein LJ206_019985 isoform 1-T1 [Theristicus caerulescens]
MRYENFSSTARDEPAEITYTNTFAGVGFCHEIVEGQLSACVQVATPLPVSSQRSSLTPCSPRAPADLEEQRSSSAFTRGEAQQMLTAEPLKGHSRTWTTSYQGTESCCSEGACTIALWPSCNQSAANSLYIFGCSLAHESKSSSLTVKDFLFQFLY